MTLEEVATLVVAPGRTVQGGITSVVRTHEGVEPWRQWRCKWIETLDGRQGWRAKLSVATAALVAFVRLLPSASLVHIHVAWKSSALRKLPFFLLAKCFGKKTIVHWHAPDFEVATAGFRGRCLLYMLRNSTITIVLSEYWLKALSSSPGFSVNRIRILPNPVDVKEGIPRELTMTILFVGRIEARKGIDVLIEAFKAVKRVLPDARLRLAGDNLEYLSEHFTMEDLEGVVALGWLSREQLQRELTAAALMCLPSRAEGVPMAVLEAMASGCPVVTTNAGGLVDLVRHGVNGLVVEVDDIDGLRTTLLQALMDRDLALRLAEEARREVVANYSVSTVASKLSAIYRELTGPAGSGCSDE